MKYRLLLLVATLCAWALPADAASIYWSASVTAGGGANCTNGTYKWDADSGTGGAAHKCWATATNGTTAAAIPGASDVAIFDASSGSGSILVNAPNNASGAAMVNLNGITTSGYGGTLDFSNDTATVNNVTLAGNLLVAGSTAMTLNMGTGTWLFTGASALGQFADTSLTCVCNGANMTFSTAALLGANRQLTTATAITFGNLIVTDTNGNAAVGGSPLGLSFTATPTFGNVTFNGPLNVQGSTGQTANVGGTLTLNGSVGNYVSMGMTSSSGQLTWHWSGAPATAITGAIMNRQKFTCGSAGAIAATSSIDSGGNAATTCSLTITPPASGSVGIIGGS